MRRRFLYPLISVALGLAVSTTAITSRSFGATGCAEIFKPPRGSGALLTDGVRGRKPWTRIEANSEQIQPIYLGTQPKDLERGAAPQALPSLPIQMRKMADEQALRLAGVLESHIGSDGAAIEFEVWPYQMDNGQRNWVFARWRAKGDGTWKWLSPDYWVTTDGRRVTKPFLPVRLNPRDPKDSKRLFQDFMTLDDLYSKNEDAIFGDIVWTTPTADAVVASWLPPERYKEFEDTFTKKRKVLAFWLPQPARFNAEPITFTLRVQSGEVKWLDPITWNKPERTPDLKPNPVDPGDRFHTTGFEAYRDDVLIFSGDKDAVFPISGKRVRFVRKSSAEKNHQLEDMVDYLEERYLKLGLQIRRQRFKWRGIPQSNLIVRIPGTLPPEKNKPILMIDHIDTAFAQDEFEKTKKRVSVSGADDNVTAIAALLRAAEVFDDLRPKHDIWLVHVTGEEYPTDDLGARALISELNRNGRQIGGVVVLDMIGFRKPGDPIFQINPGESPGSLELAQLALDAWPYHAPDLQARVRPRFDKRSYLYNTDGLIFDHYGYPVILINEHINNLENIDRRHYHETTDTSDRLDWTYAWSIVRVALEAVKRAAMR